MHYPKQKMPNKSRKETEHYYRQCVPKESYESTEKQNQSFAPQHFRECRMPLIQRLRKVMNGHESPPACHPKG